MRTTLLIALSVMILSTLSAQLSPEQAVAEMGRGINLGNTLEPPLEGGWNNGPAQESYFDAYLEAGFSNVRVPVRWDRHTSNSAPYAIDESWMNRVEQVIDWGLERGFYITLNGHHEDWLKNGYNNANLRARYDAMWVQIADRFKDKSEKLLFEIINEPNGMTRSQVDDLNARILGIIRASNPTRLVIYGGNMYANVEQLLAAAIPQDDYLIGYYHSYDPWSFSGQAQGTWGTASDYQQLTSRFNTVKNWSESNGIPIHYSEFGAIRNCDYNSRMRIYAHYTERAVASGFALSVWDDGGDFRMLDRGPNKWPAEKDIIMHYYEDSPNNIRSSVETDPVTEENVVKVTWDNRTDSDQDIVIERSTNGTDFTPLSVRPAGTEEYIDANVISGNVYIYRMYTSRSDGTLLHGYPTRVVLNTSVQGPYQGNTQAIPGIIESEFYDNGGEGVAYHDSDSANQGSNFRPGEGVDIGGDGQGGYLLGYVANNEWLEFTVDVKETGLYKVNARVASEIANGRFSLTFSGNGASTVFDTPSTGGWVTMQDITANSTIMLEAGVQIMTLDILNGNAFNLDNITFSSLTSDENIYLSADQITVYPNPSSDSISLNIDGNITGAVSIKLYDEVGKLMIDKQIDAKHISFDVSHLIPGNYTLVVENNGSQVSRVVSKI